MILRNNGICFVATGDRCRMEVLFASMSVKKSNPDISICLFTDKSDYFSDAGKWLDDIRVMPEPSFSFSDKIYGFLNSPFDRTLFIDTDTFVAGDISDIFEILEKYDLAACHGLSLEKTSARIPETFAEYNTGVVCYRKSPDVTAMLEDWRAIYASNPEYPHDQPAFREALYNSRLSICTLPRTYNFVPARTGVIIGKVKIFHTPIASQAPEKFLIAVNEINEYEGPRMYVPPGKMIRLG